jgi:lipoate-protein ligase A
MAIEEAMLFAVNEARAPNTIRFWRDRESVIIGRSQKIEEEVNLDKCAKFGVRVLRRFTGGGAVYHDLGNLNWSIVINRSSRLYPKRVLEVYEEVCGVIVESLRYLGVEAKFEEPNNIMVDGKKVSGSAAYIKKNAALCHGTLLMNANLTNLNNVLSRPRYAVTNIIDGSEKTFSLSIPLLKMMILLNFGKLYQIKFRSGKLSQYEIKLAALFVRKYRSRLWNFKEIGDV